MMGGGDNRFTQEMDIYAFAICCCEVLDKGAMPWQHQDDSAVVRFVLGTSYFSTIKFLIS
jgi:abelson tyrosine-protein kinase 1